MTTLPFFSVTSRLLIGLVAASAFIGCRPKPAPSTTPPTARIQTIQSREIDGVVIASGAIEAVNKSALGFLVAGRIATLEAGDGQQVAEGQVLARLDDSDLRKQLAIAEARESEIRSRFERLERLHTLGSLTTTDFEKIRAARDEAVSSLALAQRQFDYATLRAPFAGRLIRHQVAAGTVVGPGTPVFTVIAESPVWAVVNLAEVDVPHVRIGAAAEVSLPSLGGHRARGVVESISPQAEPLTRSFAARIRFDNTDGRFRDGNVVTATLTTGGRRAVISLAPTVLHRDPDGTLYVWTLAADRPVVSRRIVSTGAPLESEIEITAGLSPGDRVVTHSSSPLYEGQTVTLSAP